MPASTLTSVPAAPRSRSGSSASQSFRGIHRAPWSGPGRSSTSGSVSVEPPVEIGKIDFGSFRRLTPISEDFGCDRGRPIDRHYIEKFLAARASDIAARSKSATTPTPAGMAEPAS